MSSPSPDDASLSNSKSHVLHSTLVVDHPHCTHDHLYTACPPSPKKMRWIIRHAAWVIFDPESSLHSICTTGGPSRGKIPELGVSLLAHFPEVGKGSKKIQPRSWPTGGKMKCGWTRVTSPSGHLVKTGDWFVSARSVRRVGEQRWSEESL